MRRKIIRTFNYLCLAVAGIGIVAAIGAVVRLILEAFLVGWNAAGL